MRISSVFTIAALATAAFGSVVPRNAENALEVRVPKATTTKTTSTKTTSTKTSSSSTKTSSSSTKTSTSTSTSSSSSTSKSSSSSSSSSSTSSSSSSTSLVADAACTNGPTTRSCWSGGYSIATDFDTKWPTTGNTVSYTLEITNITLAPDGFSRMVLAVNGQYPGPAITANWGDTISVVVKNSMANNGTSIHWHGLRQYHSNMQDGVPGITECPIAPGDSATYTFQATQYGTSWYHSHFSGQYGDGVLGPIIIYGPATANYDLDLGALPFSDWYYQTVAQKAYISATTPGLPPEADNGLINGTMVSTYGGAYATTSITSGKKYRLRLINTSVDNHFMVSLDSHTFEVITSDFVPIKPYTAEWIFMGIGQRYDVIISANQTVGNYWFRAEVMDVAGCGTNANNGNIKSIFSYVGAASGNPTSTAFTYTQRCTDETQLVPYWNSFVPSTAMTAADTGILDAAIDIGVNTDGSSIVTWGVNLSALSVNWDKPILSYVYSGNTSYPSTENLISLDTASTWYYWVIQEAAGSPVTINVPHPIHLHGHDFYVLGTGIGDFAASDISGLTFTNPPRRDVAMLPSGGWLALAFQTDNPGAWIMHCHIAWHAGEGLAVQFLESVEDIPTIQPETTAYSTQCANWDAYYPAHAVYLKDDSGI